MSVSGARDSSSRRASPQEARSDGARWFGDVWRRLGISGEASGTSGVARRSLLFGYANAIVVGGAVCAMNVISIDHAEPKYGLAAPIVWEASSWFTVVLFVWIPWIAHRIAPLAAPPRWKLLVHIPAALLFSLAHVGGFVGLRKLVYWLCGENYDFGAFLPNFGFELSKDALSYALLLAGFSLVERLLRRNAPVDPPEEAPTFDIRDGSRLTRVRLNQVLALSSAGNYVEFVLKDGRRLLMRSSLSALESEFSACGFLRTHRSWMLNAEHMTGLKPEGSGDYTVELGSLGVPLSRRYPEALAKLRSG